MLEPDYESELTSLRRSYVELTPRQRFTVAKQRIQNPADGPNVLVASVSAVEGFARCLAMHSRAPSRAERSALYPEYRFKGAEELINEYLAKRGLGEAGPFFGVETWRRFQYAVEYRNLLAHECTYLGQDRSPALVKACWSVLEKLAVSEGLNVGEA